MERMDFANSENKLLEDQVVMSFVNAKGVSTESYPSNPNGTKNYNSSMF